MKLIHYRKPDDCVICSVAMLLDKTYEEVEALFPRWDEPTEDGTKRGISDSEYILATYRLGHPLVWLALATRDERGVVVDLTRAARELLQDRKALLIVRNPLRHLVAWDGSMIYDPRFDEPKEFSEYVVTDIFVSAK